MTHHICPYCDNEVLWDNEFNQWYCWFEDRFITDDEVYMLNDGREQEEENG